MTMHSDVNERLKTLSGEWTLYKGPMPALHEKPQQRNMLLYINLDKTAPKLPRNVH